MKITKTQLRKIIQEELQAAFNEGEGDALVDNIPQGAIVGPMSDPLGIFYYIKGQEGTDGEIYAGQFDPISWERLASRKDLKFMYRHNEISAEDFYELIPRYWIINAISTHLDGYMSGFPPEWIWKEADAEWAGFIKGQMLRDGHKWESFDFEDWPNEYWRDVLDDIEALSLKLVEGGDPFKAGS
jgi:hypothetical protein